MQCPLPVSLALVFHVSINAAIRDRAAASERAEADKIIAVKAAEAEVTETFDMAQFTSTPLQCNNTARCRGGTTLHNTNAGGSEALVWDGHSKNETCYYRGLPGKH